MVSPCRNELTICNIIYYTFGITEFACYYSQYQLYKMYTKVSVFSRYHFVVEHIFNFPQRYTMMATSLIELVKIYDVNSSNFNLERVLLRILHPDWVSCSLSNSDRPVLQRKESLLKFKFKFKARKPAFSNKIIFSKNLLVYYCKCCNLIGYATRYLFVNRYRVVAILTRLGRVLLNNAYSSFFQIILKK